MWFRKKAPVVYAAHEECAGCGCLMRGARKRVAVMHYPFRETVALYCSICAPPYDAQRHDGVGWRYYREEPAQNIEVNEKGKAIS